MNSCHEGLRAEELLKSRKMSRSEIDRWVGSDVPMLPQEMEVVRNIIRLRHGEAISGIAMTISLLAILIALSSVGAASIGVASTVGFSAYMFVLALFFMGMVQWIAKRVSDEADRITCIEVAYFRRGPQAAANPEIRAPVQIALDMP